MSAMPFNSNPLLAVSVGDLLIQVAITLLALGLYHVATAGRKKAGSPAVGTREQPAVGTPAAPIPAASSVAPAGVVQPAVAKNTESPASELAAVLAAAVAVVLARPHRVLSVQHIGVVETRFNVWAHEGRQRIFDSHKFR